MRYFIIICFLFLAIGCQSTDSDTPSGPQGESIIIDRFHIVYWKEAWGYGNGVNQCYLTIAVPLEKFNAYRQGDLVAVEDLIDPNFHPYTPDGTETLYVFDPTPD